GQRLRKPLHGSFGSWPADSLLSVTIRQRRKRGLWTGTNLLLGLKAIHNGSKLAQDLVGLLMVLNLCGKELAKIAKRLWGVQHLFRPYVSSFAKQTRSAGHITFFMTPTASSVWVTNSSSAFSISS